MRGIVGSFIDQFVAENARYDQYDLPGLQTAVLNQFGAKLDPEELAGLGRREIEERVNELLTERYDEKERMIGPDNLRQAERIIMLNVVDNQWKDHLLSMDHLKEGIGLRGYGQKDPLIEYKKESFTMFQDMMDRIEDETIRYLYFMRIERWARNRRCLIRSWDPRTTMRTTRTRKSPSLLPRTCKRNSVKRSNPSSI